MNNGGGYGDGLGAGAGAGDGFGEGNGGGMYNAMPAPSLTDFKSKDVVGGAQSFLDSNSYVAKAAFLILVVIVFVYVLRGCITVVAYLFSPNSSPYLVNGVIDGNVGNLIIPQDPNETTAVPIIRSVNDDVGIGFTWSVWLFIKQSVLGTGTAMRHVFNKGSATANAPTAGIMSPNNGPGLYLKPDYSGMTVVMSTFTKADMSVDVDNIPINKWFNVVIRVENTVLDVFVNGDLAQRLPLNAVPFQNYGDVNVAINGGFNGNLSSLRYYNTALGTRAIQTIVNGGPNLTVLGGRAAHPPPWTTCPCAGSLNSGAVIKRRYFNIGLLQLHK